MVTVDTGPLPGCRSRGRGQKSQGRHIFKYNIGCMQQPPRKKSLAICKLYSHLTRPRNLYRYERRTGCATSFDVIAAWAREETRNTIFSKLLKLLSPRRLSSLFTFAHRLIFHVVQAAAYQAVRYTAEIMQADDTTGQLKHKIRKNVTLWTSPNRTKFVKKWFWLIFGINIALLSVTFKFFSTLRAGLADAMP